jgi:hypothetical protein
VLILSVLAATGSGQRKQRQSAAKHRLPPGDSPNHRDGTAPHKGTSDIAADAPSWISLVVAVTFAVQALLIGTILSTGPLLVADAMGYGAWHVGLTFAGEHALSKTLR